MFENQAIGWHGSYSTVGRNSAEKYPMVLIKDKILKDKCEKKVIKDYFNTDDDIENNKIIIDDGEDIFSQTTNKKNKNKKKITEICDHQNKEKIPDEYKYHQLHHKELYDYNLLLKKQRNYGTNANMYAPKKDITWRRTVTGPYWDTITGRDKKSIFGKTAQNTDANFYIDHDTFKSENKTFQMDKQTKRGQLPTSYDLRIRIDEPFYENNSRKIENKNKLLDSEIGETSKNEKSKINQNQKKKDNKKNNHSLSFAKNLSRDQYYFLNRDRRGVRPFFNPNYNLVEPKSLSMVKYNNKPKGRSISKRMKGIDFNLFFEPDKVINKINNHKIANAPNLKIMVGRVDDDNDKNNLHLPGHMMKIYNRNSLEVLTAKGLLMNNFIDAGLGNDYTSFCNKKSFNVVINHNLLKNNKGIKDSKLRQIARQLNTKERINKLMEFYSKNLDNQNSVENFRKFDGITFKTIKNKEQLTEREKKLFSLKFDN